MEKKDIFFLSLIFVLLSILMWQFLAKSALGNRLSGTSLQLTQAQKYNDQLLLLSGIGPLKSTHIHADVKVYVNGRAIDFSQKKYQLTTSYMHFEEGIGDAVHIHATDLTGSHLLKSVFMDFRNNCLVVENNSYCNDSKNKLRFFVNGKEIPEFGSYAMEDLDKILISYGSYSAAEVQAQLDSVTSLASKYSSKSTDKN